MRVPEERGARPRAVARDDVRFRRFRGVEFDRETSFCQVTGTDESCLGDVTGWVDGRNADQFTGELDHVVRANGGEDALDPF
ncbi:hypothetical protein HRbin27_01568 [bacterium HR27]|nr:hypothetical protein HRbin27_01568 [bacterium HR27]